MTCFFHIYVIMYKCYLHVICQSVCFFGGGQKRSNTVDSCEGVQSWSGHANGHQRPETAAWEMRWKDSQKIIPEAHQNGARDLRISCKLWVKSYVYFWEREIFSNGFLHLSVVFLLSHIVCHRFQDPKCQDFVCWLVVSNIFIFTPIWGRFPIWLYNIFQMGWNHQPVCLYYWGPVHVFSVPNGQPAPSWTPFGNSTMVTWKQQ